MEESSDNYLIPDIGVLKSVWAFVRYLIYKSENSKLFRHCVFLLKNEKFYMKEWRKIREKEFFSKLDWRIFNE